MKSASLTSGSWTVSWEMVHCWTLLNR
jgi:hypothetical protein